VREPEDIPTVRRRVPGATQPGDDDKDYLRSAGGRPIPDKGAPWQAEIYGPFPAERFPEKSRAGKALWQLQHYCGGSLIAHDWVLTAAHCIDQDMVNAGYRVRLGAEDISRDDGMNFKIDRIVRHANYDTAQRPTSPNMYANDIALLHIVDDGPVRARNPSQIREIGLHQGPTMPAGDEVTGTGWGKTLPVEGNTPNAVLLKVDLKVMDQVECMNLPTYGAAKIHGKVFCATNPRRSTCQGDSGGPIIFTNGVPTLVGIISWGKKRCTGDGQPGVYTRVESYVDWIHRAMKMDPKKNSLP
jgi:secreted trypsin-like serine protease